jgi:hypothetical protein
MPFDRKVFFDSVRGSLFGGSLTQSQVDGMGFKLDQWAERWYSKDPRHLGYSFATSYHETGAMMIPVREGFCKTDQEAREYVRRQGYPYAKVDPVTGEVYYGRGDIQTTWAENYKKAGKEIGIGDELYQNPELMLQTKISADCLFQGMMEGWYRGDKKGRQTLPRYFNETVDDAYNAREIVNGDKAKVPSWSNGVSIGKLISIYHSKFLTAIEAAWTEPTEPPEEPTEPDVEVPTVTITTTGKVILIVNGEQIVT